MKYSIIYILSLCMLFGNQGCSRKYQDYNKYLTCNDNNFNFNKNDTTQIIYEALLRTIGEQHVPDFQLIKDKKNIFVLNTYFKPHCSDQDTSAYQRFKEVHSIPFKIGSTRFCLKSKEEIRAIANLEKETVVALQIGYITIKVDTAITGILTYPFLPKNNNNKKQFLLSGGGRHFKFQKLNGNWIYIGNVFCEWIS